MRFTVHYVYMRIKIKSETSTHNDSSSSTNKNKNEAIAKINKTDALTDIKKMNFYNPFVFDFELEFAGKNVSVYSDNIS